MRAAGGRILGDRVFSGVVLLMAAAVIGIIVSLFLFLAYYSALPLSRFGLGFFYGLKFDPIHQVFGVLPEIYGSIVTSLIALLLGVPVSIGVAVFLSELAPDRLKTVMSLLVEMLAAIPSVVYGLWGLFILAPLLEQ